MTSTARLLCLMGSGETAPPMASVHADLMRRVDSPPGRAVMLDTPYGFQENADEISARARAYFRVNVGHPLEVASLRDQESADPIALARLHDQLGDARYVLSTRDGLEARRAKAVRGVVLKTDELSFDEWLDALAHDLAAEAQTNEQAQLALQQLLVG